MAEPNRTPDGEPLPDDETRTVEVRPAQETERLDTSEARGSEPAPARSATAPTTAAAVPAAPAEQPRLEPAEDDGPPPPKRHGNRLVATAWVLLAAGLFQVLLLVGVALLALLLGAPAAALPSQLASVIASPFIWLPVVALFVLFELAVLLLGRAGRFAYVVVSLIVGLLVWALSVILIPTITTGVAGDAVTIGRTAVTPLFVLVGLVAREVVLWTGFAIGARGKRVRTRDRIARERYREESAARAERA